MEELTSGTPGPPRSGSSTAGLPGPVATLDLTTATDLTAGRSGVGAGSGGAVADLDDPGALGGGGAGEWEPPPRMKFASFVVTEADRLLGTAYLLTGDQEQAEELVRAALADAAVGWAGRHTNPTADVLHQMARRCVGPIWWWQRPNTTPAPITDDADPTLERIGNGLTQLCSQHRVALVLRYHQHCTDEETAAALGAPVGNVRTWLSRALDRLGIDTRLDLRPDAGPGLSRGGLSTTLAALASTASGAPMAALGSASSPGASEPTAAEGDDLGSTATRVPDLADALRLDARLSDGSLSVQVQPNAASRFSQERREGDR